MSLMATYHYTHVEGGFLKLLLSTQCPSEGLNIVYVLPGFIVHLPFSHGHIM